MSHTLRTFICRTLSRILSIFPIKKNRLIFTSHKGVNYECNPKYISEYIQENYPGKYEIIWAFMNPKKYSGLKNVRKVRFASLAFFYYMVTSKIVFVNNNPILAYFPLRKGQLHINTWHGGGCYKSVALYNKTFSKKRRDMLAINNEETSYMISTNERFTKEVLPEDFGYFGKTLDIGFPRNDILIQGNYENSKKKVQELYNLDEDTDIILYAPTHRDAVEVPIPDIEAVMKAYEERFGKKCVFLLRGHINTLRKKAVDYGIAINASDYPDMQELLCATDMLISDYSSCIWDYSFTYKPCILYVPDLDSYLKVRTFRIDIQDWRFPVAKSDSELINIIHEFDLEKHKQLMKKHHEDLGSFEDGHARQKIADLINEFCETLNDTKA